MRKSPVLLLLLAVLAAATNTVVAAGPAAAATVSSCPDSGFVALSGSQYLTFGTSSTYAAVAVYACNADTGRKWAQGTVTTSNGAFGLWITGLRLQYATGYASCLSCPIHDPSSLYGKRVDDKTPVHRLECTDLPVYGFMNYRVKIGGYWHPNQVPGTASWFTVRTSGPGLQCHGT